MELRTARIILYTALLFSLVVRPVRADRHMRGNTVTPLRAFDILIGHDKTTTFSLTWRDIQTDRSDYLFVSRNGELLNADRFRIDGKNGTITFAEPLPNGSIARVEYTYLPALDNKNRNRRGNGGLNSPLTFSLARIGDTAAVDLIAVPTDTSDRSQFVWHGSGGGNFLNGKLAAQLYLDPQGNLSGDDTGLKIGYAVGKDADRYAIRTDFTRIGRDFANDAGKQMEMGTANQNLTVAARARPVDPLRINVNLTEITDLTTRDQQQKSEIAAVLHEKQNRFTLEIARQNTVQNPANRQNEYSTGSDAITITLRPDKTVTLSATERDNTKRASDKTEATGKTQTGRIEITPDKNGKLTGTMERNISADGTVAQTNDIAVQMKRGRIETSGGFTNRDGTGNDLETLRGGMSIKPSDRLNFSGSLIRNPTDNGTPLDAIRQEYGIQAHMGFLQIGSGYTFTETVGAHLPDSGELRLDISLRFNAHTSLIGNFKNSFVYGAVAPTGLSVYGLGLTHSIGDRLNISLNGSAARDRSQIGQPTDVKAEAKIGIKF